MASRTPADTGVDLDRAVLVGKVNRRDLLKRGAAAGIGAAALAGLAAPRFAPRASAQGITKLTVLTHWGEAAVKDALEPIFAEYTAQNPGVQIEHQTVAFAELLQRITTGRLGGSAPDIYHFYNLWLPDFAGSDLVAPAPAAAVADITAAYSQGTVGGVTYNEGVYGFPTEVNSYQLIYNKQLLQQAGVEQPPATWAELRAAAQKATKKDASGKMTQAGYLMVPTKGWDSGVVHPWTSLLWSNGGQYVADDHTKATFNDAAGLETLQLELDMIKDGSVDLGLVMEDFIAGKAAMITMANWWGAALRAGMTGGIENVGVR